MIIAGCFSECSVELLPQLDTLDDRPFSIFAAACCQHGSDNCCVACGFCTSFPPFRTADHPERDEPHQAADVDVVVAVVTIQTPLPNEARPQIARTHSKLWTMAMDLPCQCLNYTPQQSDVEGAQENMI
jgi:hypothetical protein